MDFFEGGAGAPGLSWKGARKGSKVTGLIMPVEEEGAEKAYRTTKQTDIDSGKVLTYSDGTERTQAEITLLTTLTGWEFTSAEYQDKQGPDDEDDGVRRLFVRGPSLPKAFKAALKSAGVKKPEIGGTVTVTFVKDEPIEGSKFRKNLFAVEYAKPTAENVAKAKAAAEARDGASDAGGSGDDEPPF